MMKGSKIISALILTTLIVPVLATSAVSDDYVVGWEEPFLVETYDSHSTYDSHCAMNENGDIVVAWKQSNGSGSNLYARLYFVGEGWSEAEVIEDASTEIMWPKVAIDSVGNAFVAWAQDNETTSLDDLWSNFYVRGVGWTGPESIEDDGTVDDFHLEILMIDGGNAVAVWTRDLPPTRVMIGEREDGVGWSEPSVLDDGGGTTESYLPSLGVDGEGNIIVVWVQSEMTEHSIMSKRYEPSSGWGAAETVAGNAFYASPLVAVGNGGDAMCAWHHYNDTTSCYELRSCAYEAGVGWDDPTLLAATAYADDMDPRIGIDKDGNAVVAWWRDGILSDDGVYSRAYDAEDGWGALMAVAYSNLGSATRPEVAMSNDGEALLIFLHDDGTSQDVRGAVYNPTGGWGPSEQLNKDSLGDVGEIVLTIDGGGNGFALWTQSDSAKGDVWAARYSSPDVIPPTVTIESPEDAQSFDSSTISVSGYTESGAYLTVNGIVVAVESDGSFNCSVILVDGDNLITATATDAAGNSASTSVTVTYEPPEDSLQDDLEEALQNLNETMDALNETREGLADAGDDLDDANDRIDSLSSQILMLGAIVILFAVISLVALAMYLSLRRQTRGPGPSSPEEEEPPSLE